jgi:threonine/homoserine/homoserine lactone efflux protein
MLLAFLGVSLLVIVTPGPDTALLIRNVVAGGRSRGVATAAGVATGQMLWALATAAGLSAVLAASTMLFEAVRLAGAAYLTVLGLLTLWQAWKGEAAAAPEGRSSGPSIRMAYALGLVSNLSNPKMAMFFPSLLPQFVPYEAAAFATSFGLGALFAAMAFGWLVSISLFLDSQAARSMPGRWRRWLGGATGVALVGFGLHFALGRR